MTDQEKVQKVLDHINPSTCSYTEWVQVGQALHYEGCDVSYWVNWSKRDPLRYHEGECVKKWQTFGQGMGSVTGKTLVHMAKANGYWVDKCDLPFHLGDGHAHHDVVTTSEAYVSELIKSDVPIDMKTYKESISLPDAAEYEGKHYGHTAAEYTPQVGKLELMSMLNVLFEPHEYVGYCVNTMTAADGRKSPVNSNCSRTAGELIEALGAAETVEDALGTIDTEAGAWFHINPCNGKGVKAENVTDYRYALVESDSMSLGDQERMLRALKLPIKMLIYSGNKSLHAIVHIGAKSAEEYRERVEFLYNLLDDYGFTVDKQNKNPNRMARLVGVMRGSQTQNIVAYEMGKDNWGEWHGETYLLSADLPLLDCTEDTRKQDIPNKPELIKGILRKGHKMNLTGPSKAGKTFLLLQLAIAISRGKKWLDFECVKNRVLYINFELDRPSCLNRIKKIEEHLGYTEDGERNLYVWNLRGHSKPLHELVGPLITLCKSLSIDAIVIDPIYKILMGDENNATQMGDFCNQLDYLATELNCSVIYCHHHSKGPQHLKKVIDRGSGSGVFSRDPDAIIDLLEVELSHMDEATLKKEGYEEGMTGWHVEGVLREFKGFAPKYMTFSYPIHVMDTSGFLKGAFLGQTDEEESEQKGKGRTDGRTQLKLRNIKCVTDEVQRLQEETGKVGVSLKVVAENTGINIKTIRNYADEENTGLLIEKGMIYLQESSQNVAATENTETSTPTSTAA